MDYDIRDTIAPTHSYTLRFYGCPIRAIVRNPIIENLTDDEWELLKFIRSNPTIQQKELASAINKDKKLVSRNISTLQKLKLIKWYGSRKEGAWEVSMP